MRFKNLFPFIKRNFARKRICYPVPKLVLIKKGITLLPKWSMQFNYTGLFDLLIPLYQRLE